MIFGLSSEIFCKLLPGFPVEGCEERPHRSGLTGFASVVSQARRHAKDHRAPILLSTGCYGKRAGLVRAALGVGWFRCRAIRDCADCVPETARFASCDSPSGEWRDACGGISASAVHFLSLDCPVGCDRVSRWILLAVSGSVVRDKWRVEYWPVAWRCGYPAVSALAEVPCRLPRRL